MLQHVVTPSLRPLYPRWCSCWTVELTEEAGSSLVSVDEVSMVAPLVLVAVDVRGTERRVVGQGKTTVGERVRLEWVSS